MEIKNGFVFGSVSVSAENEEKETKFGYKISTKAMLRCCHV